jgi:hypothetical protein
MLVVLDQMLGERICVQSHQVVYSILRCTQISTSTLGHSSSFVFEDSPFAPTETLLDPVAKFPHYFEPFANFFHLLKFFLTARSKGMRDTEWGLLKQK